MAIDFQKSSTIDFQPTREEPEKEKGFLGRLGDVFKTRTKNVKESLELVDTQQQTAPEAGFQVGGQLVGGAGDIVFEGVRALTPKFIREFIGSGVEKVAENQSIRGAVKAYSEWADKNPRSAKNLEAGFNISTALPVGRGAKVVGAVKPGRVVSFFEGRLDDQLLDEAIRVTKPTLTRTEKINVLTSGDTKKTLSGSIQSLPTDKDLLVAESVQGIVSAKKNPVVNIQKISDEIEVVAKNVDTGLKQNNAIFNNNQLTSKLSEAKEASRVVFGSEKSIENTYDAVVTEFVRIMEGKGNTVSGLWEGRKEFDSIMKSKFPKVFNNPATTDAPRYNAINDVRRAANNYIEELLPEGNAYKEQMKKMNNMYTARTNIAESAVDILDKSKTKIILEFLRANPIVSGFTGGILTYGAMTGLLTNPLLLSILATVGTFKTGKGVITSKILKKSLISVLKSSDKAGNFATSQAIRELIQTLDSYDGLREESSVGTEE